MVRVQHENISYLETKTTVSRLKIDDVSCL
jgi:hypothetical protein